MYSTPAVEPKVQNTRRSCGAERFPGEAAHTRLTGVRPHKKVRGPGGSRTCLAMYSTPAVECCSQSSDEGSVRQRALPFRHSTIQTKAALVGLEPTTPNGDVVQPAVGTCISKRTNEVVESETYGALPLSDGATWLYVAPMGLEPISPAPEACTPIRQSVLFSRRRGGGQRLRAGIQPADHMVVPSCTGRPMYSNRQSPICFQ
jgi:hypothetical protein